MKKTYFTPSIILVSTKLTTMIAISNPGSGSGETGEHGDSKPAIQYIWEDNSEEEE